MKERSEPKAGAVDKVQPIEGRSKSGRFWKAKATERNSVQLRQGIMSHLSNTYAQRMKEKERKEAIKALEKQMREEKAEEKRLAREKTEEKKDTDQPVVRPVAHTATTFEEAVASEEP